MADGNHARIDGFVSLSVVGSAAVVGLGAPIGDPIIGLVITLDPQDHLGLLADRQREARTTALASLDRLTFSINCYVMERTGIEPVTSGLQNTRGGSPRVATAP
jgi:hypothetical protein